MKKGLFSLVLLFLLTGCFNYNELNDYAIVTNMSVDYKKNNYFVSLLISNSEEENIIYSGKGKTIYEAIQDIDLISPKKLYLGHLSTLIISDKSAEKGVSDILKWFIDNEQVSKNFYIALSKDTEAINILKTDTSKTNFTSQYITKNIESSKNIRGNIIVTDFNSLLHILIDENGNPVINSLNKKKNYIKLDSLGYFKQDKLIGWTNKEESSGINIVNNQIKTMNLSLKCHNSFVNIELNNLKSIVNVKKEKTTIKVTGYGKLKDSKCHIEKKEIIKKTNNTVKNYIQKAIDLSYKEQIDIFNIKRLYYQKYKKRKAFNKINKFNVKVNIRI